MANLFMSFFSCPLDFNGLHISFYRNKSKLIIFAVGH